MKGKRHTTEEKIRALREADEGRAIREVCQERNISEATYHRWQKQFGLMKVGRPTERGRSRPRGHLCRRPGSRPEQSARRTVPVS